jgi:hypothetical protein
MSNTEAILVDKYGEQRVLRKDRHGWKVKREELTPIIKANSAISAIIGKKIKEYRTAKGLTMKGLGMRCGMVGDPKHRIWAIEDHTRKEGLRFGTLYIIATVLDVDITDLLPPKEEVLKIADVSIWHPFNGEQ